VRTLSQLRTKLVAFGGKGDSLCKRVLIRDSAFDPRQFQIFASSASCSDLIYLRQADTDTFQQASISYTKSLPGDNPGRTLV
jgi:hypothetical protein